MQRRRDRLPEEALRLAGQRATYAPESGHISEEAVPLTRSVRRPERKDSSGISSHHMSDAQLTRSVRRSDPLSRPNSYVNRPDMQPEARHPYETSARSNAAYRSEWGPYHAGKHAARPARVQEPGKPSSIPPARGDTHPARRQEPGQPHSISPARDDTHPTRRQEPRHDPSKRQEIPRNKPSRSAPGFGAALGIGPRVAAPRFTAIEERPEETPPPRPVRDNSYQRYRQSPPPGYRRRKRGGFLGRLLVILLIVALSVGLAGWFITQYRQQQAREQLQALLTEYPLNYRELIARYAGERDIEPCYIAAIIRAESSFQPDATSSVNAQGLMQILPETGEWLAGKFDETYTEGCLYDPETNIRYGCWYIEFLLKRYNNDKACASAAYHSGQGTVDGWLKNPEYSADGRTLTVIPGNNASVYVDRILNYYDIYKELYGTDLSKTPDISTVTLINDRSDQWSVK